MTDGGHFECMQINFVNVFRTGGAFFDRIFIRSLAGQRYRRWASIELAVGRRLVFAGYQPILQYYCHSGLMIML